MRVKIGAVSFAAAAMALSLFGCSAQQAQSNVNEVLEYAPPYTLTKETDACAQSKADADDAIANLACAKLEAVAALCATDLKSAATIINGDIEVVGTIAAAMGNAPVGAATIAGAQINTAILPLFQATQFAMCAAGGFSVPAAALHSAN